MRTPARRTSALAAVLVVMLVVLTTVACGGSDDSGGTGTATPAADVSPGGPSPVPSALTETYASQTYGFGFRYPSGFAVTVDPEFVQSDIAVSSLALLPTAATTDAFGFDGGNSVRLVVLVSEKTPSWQDVDADGVAQAMTAGMEGYLASLDGLEATGVEPTDIDGFVCAQAAYSYDTETGREDTWTLTLVEPDGDYRLEVQATSPADVADQLEPVWTEVINSFTTL